MKILYAVQGTGNGHFSRAQDVIPLLKKKAQVDILVSGTQSSVPLDHALNFQLHGMSFTFGKDGGIDYWDTFKNVKLVQFFKDVQDIPVQQYDLVINDFEPVTAWACQLKRKPCISLSHQCSLINPKVPRPDNVDMVGELVMKYYAPTSKGYGFHFKKYDENIFTPLIRQSIREAVVSSGDHITVYLPSYGIKQIHAVLSLIKGVRFNVFSRYANHQSIMDNVHFYPTSKEDFVESICTGQGVIANAGFETPAETLYLGKKLLAIPMKGQVEQHFNVASLNEIGILSIPELHKDHINVIQSWLDTPFNIEVDYPDETAMILDKLIAENL